MADIVKKNFNAPDETVHPGEKLTVEVVTLGGVTIDKFTAESGWKWSEHLKPVFKTESCERHHILYLISGTLLIRMNDGKEETVAAGEVVDIPPGHDAWTVGDEPAVWLEMPH